MLISKIYAGAQQLIKIAEIWNWKYISSVQMKTRARDNNVVHRPIYTFDLEGKYDSERQTSNISSWFPVWASSYNDDLGSNIFDSLGTIFPISPYGQYLTKNVKYSVLFNISPLIPLNLTEDSLDPAEYTGGEICPYGSDSPTWDAEFLLYKTVINLAYPLLVKNTVPEQSSTYRLGPIFPSKITFSCSHGENVSIEAKFDGMKYFTYPNSSAELANSVYENLYRSANFADCFCIMGENNLLASRDAKIVEMRLEMTQDWDMPPTCSANIDSKGSRFIGLKQRMVKGNIKLLAKSQSVLPFYNEVLIMYFGGPFYFKMSNIKWQKPTLDITINDGYVHNYNFIALAKNGATLQSSVDTSAPVFSEFVVEQEEE